MIDVSPGGVTTHHGALAPLTAGTKHYIVVAATDGFGHTSYRSGSFKTVTPHVDQGGHAAAGDTPGCANQCITKAEITAGDDHSAEHISIGSHTAAQFQVFVSTETLSWSDGVPTFVESDVWVSSGQEFKNDWETNLEGLAADTGYHIIVRAIDANDHVDYEAGEFQTGPAPTFDVLYTVLGIHVDNDGQKGSRRGDLRFGWRVGQDYVGTRPFDKVGSGETVKFRRPISTFVVTDVEEWLPHVIIQATEHSGGNISDFCTLGDGIGTQYWSDKDCGWRSDVAISGLITLDSLSSYPMCTDLGFDPVSADQHCLTIESAGAPAGYPDITAIVAVHVND